MLGGGDGELRVGIKLKIKDNIKLKLKINEEGKLWTRNI